MLEKIKELIINFKDMMINTSNETIVRTIVLFIMVINAFCSLVGWTPIAIQEETIYQIVSGVGVVVSALWAWWKNNSFTNAAQQADEYCAELKKAKHAKK